MTRIKIGGGLLLALALSALAGQAPGVDTVERGQLAKLQYLVGSWRGVGQPQRGSNKGAWSEKGEWKWQFDDQGNAALRFDAKESKYLGTGTLRYRPQTDDFEFAAEMSDKSKANYVGTIEQNRLVLNSQDAGASLPTRISMWPVASGDRLLMLLERSNGSTRLARLAEVGSTREGSDFGKGISYVECVVTGGHGTIPVTFEDKTYYVCCSGCRDYFNDHAADVIAKYHARLEKKKSDGKK